MEDSAKELQVEFVGHNSYPGFEKLLEGLGFLS
jgi:hypothetical protein